MPIKFCKVSYSLLKAASFAIQLFGIESSLTNRTYSYSWYYGSSLFQLALGQWGLETPLVPRLLFPSTPLTESLEQATMEIF